MLKQKAEELGVKMVERDIRGLKKAVLETIVKQEAEELGIEVKGKDAQKLQEEIHDKSFFRQQKHSI